MMNSKLFIKTFIVGVLFCLGIADSRANNQPELYLQEEITIVEQLPGDKTYYYVPRDRDNWFLSVGAGVQTHIAENSGSQIFTPSLTVDFGRWFSPYWGLRLAAVGGSFKNKYPTPDDIIKGKDVIMTVDFMIDLTNLIGGYDPYRIVSFIPFAGVGGAYVFQLPTGRTFSVVGAAGIRLNFRLCHCADFFVEGKASVVGDNFNGIELGKDVEAMLSITGGFVFNFGGKKFVPYNPSHESYVRGVLNAEVNLLREALAICDSRECPPCPPTIVTEKPVETPKRKSGDLTAAVRFNINSSSISDEEKVNVYNIAKWLDNNPDYSVSVMGYADKDTGTPKYNMKLSKKRAESVKDILVKSYNIEPSRVIVVAEGSDAQPYPKNNNWNRVVIFKDMLTKDCSK